MPTKGRPVKIGTPISPTLVGLSVLAILFVLLSGALRLMPCDGFWFGLRTFFNVACD